jgi:membrane-bound inhibitor of C-type lysozyme
LRSLCWTLLAAAISCLPALAASGLMEDRGIRTRTLAFDCARGRFSAILLLDNATILLADRGSTLQRVAGAAAETFGDGVSRFWTDGATATLTMPGAQLTDCRFNPQRAIIVAGELRGAAWAVWDTQYRWDLLVLPAAGGGWIAELTEGRRRRIFGPLQPCPEGAPAPCWSAGDPWDMRLAARGRRPDFELRLRTAVGVETRSPALGRRLAGS